MTWPTWRRGFALLVTFWALCFVLGADCGVHAQDTSAPPPQITEVQKLTVQNAALRLELAQTKVQAAQAEYDKAKTDIIALVATLQREGYTLDLNTLTYSPKKPEVKK